jgi:tetratricopeptide (TPR) repeat protein
LLKADILSRSTPDLAIRYLRDFLASQPTSRPVAASLAQMLIEQKHYEEARAVFQKLLDADPSARDLQFAVAGISVQMKDYATAERLFKELQAADYGDAGAVTLYLAQIAEETKRYDEAIARYREVTTGDRAWAAKLRIGAVMAKKGDLDAARRYLNALPADTPEQKTEVVQAEAQLLREAGDYKAASTVLGKALDASPDSTDLLYDAAMIAEKLDHIDEAEARLKRVIELKPDNAQALNALGYTLVDRTPRAAEGLKFIEQAHALAPDDPFILDSMGWAYYRIGNIDDSEKYLRQAMAQRPDAEIAAHLGEVLWAKGERAGATDIWQSQLKQTPDNPVLLETVRRLAR